MSRKFSGYPIPGKIGELGSEFKKRIELKDIVV